MRELRRIHRLHQRAVEEIPHRRRRELAPEPMEIRGQRRRGDVLVSKGDMRRGQMPVRVHPYFSGVMESFSTTSNSIEVFGTEVPPVIIQNDVCHPRPGGTRIRAS